MNINIFDLLEMLKVIGGRAVPSQASDIDQNGKPTFSNCSRC